MSLVLADAGHGDMVLIGGVEYRLTIRQRDGWFVREGRNGEHRWFYDDQPIERITFEQPKRNPKARKQSKNDLQDPMQWKGTVR